MLIIPLLLVSADVSAKERPKEYQSARHMGMGHAGIGHVTGLDAVFMNPAGISDSKNLLSEVVLLSPMFTLGANTRMVIGDVTTGSSEGLGIALNNINKPQHVGFQNTGGIVFRRVAIGLIQAVQLDALVGDDFMTGLPRAEARAQARAGIYMAFSRGFFSESFRLGTTVKYIQKGEFEASVGVMDTNTLNPSTLQDSIKRGWGVGVDAGVQWLLEDKGAKPTLGVHVKNIAATRYHALGTTYAPSSEKQTVDIGLSATPGTKMSGSKVALDYTDIFNVTKEKSPYKKLHMGAEISFQNILGARAGINQGYPSIGGFLNLKIARFDAGVITEELGERAGDLGVKRYFAQLQLGWTR